jgi:hypothetical protein
VDEQPGEEERADGRRDEQGRRAGLARRAQLAAFRVRRLAGAVSVGYAGGNARRTSAIRSTFW